MTRNGMAIVEVTDTQQKAVFIDEDTLEAARLSAMLKRNRENREAERKKIEHEQYKQRIINNKKNRWKKYIINTFSYIGVSSAIIVGSVWAMIVEMMHPIIAIPVISYFLGTACIRFGMWHGSKH